MSSGKEYYKNLPHIYKDNAIYFITFRLFGSIPTIKLNQLKIKYEEAIQQHRDDIEQIKKLASAYSEARETLLEQIETGPKYLENPLISKLIKIQLHRFDKVYYDLMCYCIMPNHVHLLIDTSIQDENKIIHPDLILKRIKGPVSVEANRILSKSGKFWQIESHDRYMRDGKEFTNTLAYILNNPVKACLVINWEDWPNTFVKNSLIDRE